MTSPHLARQMVHEIINERLNHRESHMNRQPLPLTADELSDLLSDPELHRLVLKQQIDAVQWFCAAQPLSDTRQIQLRQLAHGQLHCRSWVENQLRLFTQTHPQHAASLRSMRTLLRMHREFAPALFHRMIDQCPDLPVVWQFLNDLACGLLDQGETSSTPRLPSSPRLQHALYPSDEMPE